MSSSTDKPAIQHKLLVAMPDQGGGFFERSVILMLEHNAEGAMGLTLTQTSDVSMTDLLGNLDMARTADDPALAQLVMIGGPVQTERGFILHRGHSSWENTARISDELSMTLSLDFLKAAGQQQVTEDYQVYLGYAGWGAGQLEAEIRNNVWLFADVELDVIFDLPVEARWQSVLSRLGIQSHQISRVAGHA